MDWLSFQCRTGPLATYCLMVGASASSLRPSATFIGGPPINGYCHFLFDNIVAIVLPRNRCSWYALTHGWSLRDTCLPATYQLVLPFPVRRYSGNHSDPEQALLACIDTQSEPQPSAPPPCTHMQLYELVLALHSVFGIGVNYPFDKLAISLMRKWIFQLVLLPARSLCSSLFS
jgi:hypothetical protein